MSAPATSDTSTEATVTVSSSSHSSTPSIAGINVDCTISTLVPGVKVMFDPIAVSDYVLAYDGVEFYVHRYQLTVSSNYFRELMDRPYDNEPVIIPEHDYPSIIADVSNQQNTVPRPSQFGPPLTVQSRTRATAIDFLRFLAACYWKNCPAGSFFHRPTIEWMARVDHMGNTVLNEYQLSRSSFKDSGSGSTASELARVFEFQYANMSWAFKYDCHALLAHYFQQIEQARDNYTMNEAAAVTVWTWLAEMYVPMVGSRNGMAVSLNMLSIRNQLSNYTARVRYIRHLPPAVVSKATYRHMLEAFEIKNGKLSANLDQKNETIARYEQELNTLKQQLEPKRKKKAVKTTKV